MVELTGGNHGTNVNSLIGQFAGRHIDLKTGKIGEKYHPPMPPDNTMDALREILARLEKLEQRK